jgi:hypothetical protein
MPGTSLASTKSGNDPITRLLSIATKMLFARWRLTAMQAE